MNCDTFKVVGRYVATSRKTGKPFSGIYTLCADRDPEKGYLAEHFFVPMAVYDHLALFPLGVCVKILFNRRGMVDAVEVLDKIWDCAF